jgi:hypothetical protein
MAPVKQVKAAGRANSRSMIIYFWGGTCVAILTLHAWPLTLLLPALALLLPALALPLPAVFLGGVQAHPSVEGLATWAKTA